MERLRKVIFWAVFGFMLIGGVGALTTIWDAYYDPTFPIGFREGPFPCDYETVGTYVKSTVMTSFLCLAASGLAWRFRHRWFAIAILLAPFAVIWSGLLESVVCLP